MSNQRPFSNTGNVNYLKRKRQIHANKCFTRPHAANRSSPRGTKALPKSNQMSSTAIGVKLKQLVANEEIAAVFVVIAMTQISGKNSPLKQSDKKKKQ